MLRILLNPALALAGAFWVLAGCAGPAGTPPPKTKADPQAAWARAASGSGGGNNFQGAATDPSGNVYGIGFQYNEGTITWGDVSVSATGTGRQAFLAKFDASGEALWARSVLVSPGDLQFYGVATDSAGNVYVAGSMSGGDTYDFGTAEAPVEVTGSFSSGSNAVLVKYNPSGEAQWARSATAGPAASTFNAVAVDGSNNVSVAGAIYDQAEFDFGTGETILGQSDNDIVLVKYNSAGTGLWARTLTTAVSDNAFSALTADADGNLYAAGSLYAEGTYDFGNSVTADSSAQGSNAVLVKYNASGTAQWARTVTSGSSPSDYKGVALDDSDHVYAVGTAVGSSGEDKALIVQYDTSGTPRWERSVSGSSYSRFNAVAAFSGRVFAAGLLGNGSSFDFGPAVVRGSSTDDNAVIVGYDASGSAQWAQSTSSGSSGSLFYGLAAGQGHLYAAGMVVGSGSYGFGNDVTAAGGEAWSSSLVVRYE